MIFSLQEQFTFIIKYTLQVINQSNLSLTANWVHQVIKIQFVVNNNNRKHTDTSRYLHRMYFLLHVHDCTHLEFEAEFMNTCYDVRIFKNVLFIL